MIYGRNLIELLNNNLKFNQGSLELLKREQNKTFKILFPGFWLCAQIDIDGYLLNCNSNDFNTIIIFPLSIINYLIDKDKIAAYKLIKIHGDKIFARRIIEIFSNMSFFNIDNSQSLSKIFFFNLLNKFLNILKSYTQLVINNAQSSIIEYYLYETGDIVSKDEVASFCTQVDNLSDIVNRLEAKLNLSLKVLND